MARGVKRLANALRTASHDGSGAAHVEEALLLAGEARVGRSSAVADERTATSVASSPYCARER